MLCNGVSQGKYDYQRSCDRRPQSSNQERAISDQQYFENGLFHRLTSLDFLDSLGNESSTGHQPQEHESRTRPAAGKCGE
jgi:hypothetical protein